MGETRQSRLLGLLSLAFAAWLVLVPFGASGAGPVANCGSAFLAAGEGMDLGPAREEAGCREAARIRLQQGVIVALFGGVLLSIDYGVRRLSQPRGSVG